MPGRTKLRQGQTQTSKEEGGSTSRTTAQIEKYYSGGKRPFTYKKNDRGKVIKVELKGGGMSSGQAKIAAKAPPPNKIDAKDFAVLRQEKARGRGMGLQDEKVKPGKVMKAGLGLMFMKKAKDKGAKGAEFLSPVAMAKRMFNKKAGGVIKARVGRSVTRIPLAGKSTSVGSTTMKGMKFSDKAKMVDSGKINKATGKFTSMEALRESVGYRPGESTDKFNKRRMALAAAKKAVSASKIGKIALGIGTAGVAASQYIKSKMNKKNNKTLRDARLQKKPGIPSETTQKINKALSNIKTVKLKKDKKMGGGMMKPMGYKHGTEPGAGPLGGIGKAGRKAGRSALTPAGRPASPSKEISKEKISRAEKFFKTVDDRTKQFTGPKSTRGSVGSAVNKFREMSDNMRISKKKSGGMMKPMGYKSGTMVKARGCKLGRTRPTKIT